MKREVIIFIVVYIAVATLCALGAQAVGAMPKPAKDMAGLVLLPALFVPLIMAYILNRMEGAAGGPFRGLSWGGTTGIWSGYGIALLAGLFTLIASVGMGWMGIDPEMSDYIEMMKSQSGQEVPSSADGMFKLIGTFTLIGSPTIGPFIGAFIASLATLPFYGWLGRRLLANGRGAMVGGLVLLTALTAWTQAMAPNPMTTDIPKWFVLLSYTLMGIGSALAGSWLFLRYNSAFVPALFASTFNGVVGAAMVISSDANLVFAPPLGLTVTAALLLTAIALWVIKDPGNSVAAIAAVGPDGTPLSPAQLKAMQENIPAPGASHQPMPPAEEPPAG